MADDVHESMRAAGMPIPERLINAIKFLRGDEAGVAWLTGLNHVLQDYEHRWGLAFEAIAEGGAMSCCAYCRNEAGVEMVLKIPVDSRAGAMEANTLERWQSIGVSPKIVEVDRTSGVMLMERLRPGTTYQGVKELDDLTSTVDMFNRLAQAGRKSRHEDVPSLSTVMTNRLGWASERFKDPAVSALRPDLERAKNLAFRLSSANVNRVVHGDLQAKNLIWGPEGRLFCIDPLTAYGDPASDPAMWAVLQDSEHPIQALIERIARELQMPVHRLEQWAYVIASFELRPAQPRRYKRMRAFLDVHEAQEGV